MSLHLHERGADSQSNESVGHLRSTESLEVCESWGARFERGAHRRPLHALAVKLVVSEVLHRLGVPVFLRQHMAMGVVPWPYVAVFLRQHMAHRCARLPLLPCPLCLTCVPQLGGDEERVPEVFSEGGAWRCTKAFPWKMEWMTELVLGPL